MERSNYSYTHVSAMFRDTSCQRFHEEALYVLKDVFCILFVFYIMLIMHEDLQFREVSKLKTALLFLIKLISVFIFCSNVATLVSRTMHVGTRIKVW